MDDLRRLINLIESFEDDEDEEELDLPSVAVGESLRPALIQAAQEEYNDWDVDDEDKAEYYAGGGICHYIADRFVEILQAHNINCSSVSSDHEQHVYVVAQFAEGVYMIDLHYNNYETGGGFTWKKIPEVEFDPSDIDFYRLSIDPKDFEQYTGDY